MLSKRANISNDFVWLTGKRTEKELRSFKTAAATIATAAEIGNPAAMIIAVAAETDEAAMIAAAVAEAAAAVAEAVSAVEGVAPAAGDGDRTGGRVGAASGKPDSPIPTFPVHRARHAQTRQKAARLRPQSAVAKVDKTARIRKRGPTTTRAVERKMAAAEGMEEQLRSAGRRSLFTGNRHAKAQMPGLIREDTKYQYIFHKILTFSLVVIRFLKDLRLERF